MGAFGWRKGRDVEIWEISDQIMKKKKKCREHHLLLLPYHIWSSMLAKVEIPVVFFKQNKLVGKDLQRETVQMSRGGLDWPGAQGGILRGNPAPGT